MKPTYFRFAQLALTGLTLVFALAVVGTTAHTISIYNKQHNSNPWWAPLWPEHFDTNGTKGLLGAGVTVVILNAIYLGLSFMPAFNLAGRPTFRAFVTVCTVLPGAFVMLSTTVLAHVLNSNAPEIDTIQSWTCRFGERAPGTEGMEGENSNQEFSRLCTESKFALYTSLTIFLLQIVMLGLVIVSWVADQWAKRKTTKEWKDNSSMEMGAPPPNYSQAQAQQTV